MALINGREKFTNVSGGDNSSSEHILVFFFVFTLDKMTSCPSCSGRGPTSPGLHISLRWACFVHSASFSHSSCILYCRSSTIYSRHWLPFQCWFSSSEVFHYFTRLLSIPPFIPLSATVGVKKNDKKKEVTHFPLAWFQLSEGVV